MLFYRRFEFVTTEYTVSEVKKYLPEIASKAEVSEEYIKKTFDLLPLKVKGKQFYESSLEQAENQIGDIDKKDKDILALAIETGNYLWTDDKDFDRVEYKKVVKTKDFF